MAFSEIFFVSFKILHFLPQIFLWVYTHPPKYVFLAEYEQLSDTNTSTHVCLTVFGKTA